MEFFVTNQHFLTVLTHYFSGYTLLGLIWTIQIVHYPLFQFINPSQFLLFHKKHTQLISFVVGPLMIAEALSLIMLFFYEFHSPKNVVKMVMLGILVLIWATTLLIHIPLHNKLSKGYDANAVNKLIQTNWIRTILWTIKALIMTLSGIF